MYTPEYAYYLLDKEVMFSVVLVCLFVFLDLYDCLLATLLKKL